MLCHRHVFRNGIPVDAADIVCRDLPCYLLGPGRAVGPPAAEVRNRRPPPRAAASVLSFPFRADLQGTPTSFRPSIGPPPRPVPAPPPAPLPTCGCTDSYNHFGQADCEGAGCCWEGGRICVDSMTRPPPPPPPPPVRPPSPPSCTGSEFITRTHTVSDACCDETLHPCISGLPTACTSACAEVLLPMQVRFSS